jgi:hypothetical protein
MCRGRLHAVIWREYLQCVFMFDLQPTVRIRFDVRLTFWAYEQILTPEDVVPQCELRKGSGYRIYSAKSGGRVVIVKTFHGARAKRVNSITNALGSVVHLFKQ